MTKTDHTTSAPTLVYNGTLIRDRDDHLNLTDMWRAAGSPLNKRPVDWLKHAGAEFVEFVAANLKVDPVHVERGGRNPATWGHWQVGIAYAKYLSSEFHAWCNSIVRAHMEGTSPASTLTPDVIRGIMRGLLTEVVPPMIEAKLAQDPRVAVGEYKPALKVLIERGVPSKGRRGFANRVSYRLRTYCTEHGIACRRDIWRGVWVYPIAAVNDWLKQEGGAMIADHCAELAGQRVIPLFPEHRSRRKPENDGHVA